MTLLIIGIGLAVLAVIAAALAWRLAASLRSRHQGLLAAVELTQRQLTELRSAQDLIAAEVARGSTLLASKIEPDLNGVARYLKCQQTAAEVQEARQAGRLDGETAERLLNELERLAEDSLAGEKPY